MGVGTPINLLEGIERGIDMFDCIMPTRNGATANFSRVSVLSICVTRNGRTISRRSIRTDIPTWIPYIARLICTT